MKDFDYVATHKGEENCEFYAAEYMVNCDGRVVAFKLEKEGVWKDADPVSHPYQVFPRVSALEVVK